MAKRGGLGSGLGALFAEDYEETEAEKSERTLLPITQVEPREDQPRKQFDAETLAELAESIRRYGLIQPLTVRPLEDGYYQIIAGERRWRAAREAGLQEVPVRVIEADDRTAMEMALVENLQREDLNPIEEAKGYKTLMTEYGMTQEEAAAAVGKSRPAVANALRLLNLTPYVLKMVESGEISPGHGRALIPLSEENLQAETAIQILQRQLTVRQTEQIVNRLLNEQKAKQEEEPTQQEAVNVDYIREVERELENAMGRKVRLVDGRKKGRIELEFYGAEDREKLIENLRLFSSLRRNK